MYLRVCVWLDTNKTPHRNGVGYFIDKDGHMIPSIKPSTLLKKEEGMANMVLKIFCSMTLFKKMINYGDISKKLILGTFTFSSSFSNSSNLKGKICNMLFHCRTFFLVGAWSQRSPEHGFRVFLRLWTRSWTKKCIHDHEQNSGN